MEEIIKTRLSVNLLDTEEFNIFVKELGKDQIISLMLKGFLFMYQNSQNQHQMTNVNNIVSNIIQSRETNKLYYSNENTTHIESRALKINNLPNVLIRECASYLEVIDYLHFSQCDGLIYVSCNSPSSLQYLDMTKDGYPNNLNKFSLLKTIRLEPEAFNENYANSSVVLNHINSLSLDMYSTNLHSEIVTFMNMKCIDFTEITSLTLLGFGSKYELYDFRLFCELLNKFPNVNYLDMYQIYFDQFIFTDETNMISKLLPQLKTFMFGSDDMTANFFRNKLIETHSKQIINLDYDEEINILGIDSLKSLALKRLTATHPTIGTLSQVVKQSTELESVFVNLSGFESSKDNDQQIEHIISSLYAKYSKMNEIQICISVGQFDKLIEWTQNGLSKSKYIKDYWKIIYDIWYKEKDICMHQMSLHLMGMINALGSTKHFMVIFRMLGCVDTIDVKKKLELINLLNETYLVFDETGKNDDGDTYQQIIVSNKTCVINGCQEIVQF